MGALTFRGVTVHRILMMLLDFSCPSWGFFLRNRRLLSKRKEQPRVMTYSQMFTIHPMFNLQWTTQLQCQQGSFPVYGSSLSSSVVRWGDDLNTTVSVVYCFAFQIQAQWLFFSVFTLCFHSNQVTRRILNHWVRFHSRLMIDLCLVSYKLNRAPFLCLNSINASHLNDKNNQVLCFWWCRYA